MYSSRGIQLHGTMSSIMPYFVGAYRGGRNESFIIGLDTEMKYHDFDLSGAYPTAIASLGQPDYASAKEINIIELNNFFSLNVYSLPIKGLSETRHSLRKSRGKKLVVNYKILNKDLLFEKSYAVFKVNFEFPGKQRFRVSR